MALAVAAPRLTSDRRAGRRVRYERRASGALRALGWYTLYTSALAAEFGLLASCF